MDSEVYSMTLPALDALDEDCYTRQRAYYLWEADGRPSGRDLEYWESARVLHDSQKAEVALPSTRQRYEGGISAQPPVT
jgi:hypothetical protein